MPFIGNQPALSYTSFAKQDFTTSATTSYTLDQPVANANELALFINFVRQEPTTAYTASGTSLTLTSATSATDDMYCVFLGKAVQTVNPPSGSVGISQLSATGTKDATTFLRGDNTFASAGGTNTPAFEGYSTNGQTPADATETKIELDGESFDTDSAFDTSTYRFTVPSGKGGKYYVYGNIAVDSQEDNGVIHAYIRIKKNGTTNLLESYYNFSANYPRDVAILVHGTVTLNAGDYIELYGYLNDSSNSGLDFKGASGTRLATLMGAYKIIE